MDTIPRMPPLQQLRELSNSNAQHMPMSPSIYRCSTLAASSVREGKTITKLKMAYPTDAAAKYFVALALKDILGLP